MKPCKVCPVKQLTIDSLRSQLAHASDAAARCRAETQHAQQQAIDAKLLCDDLRERIANEEQKAHSDADELSGITADCDTSIADRVAARSERTRRANERFRIPTRKGEREDRNFSRDDCYA